MGKYDFSLDINANETNAIILSRIKENSTILEFGPYKGRATKYLKEKLKCSVYAVELDEDAAAECSKYTEKIIIGDIEEGNWAEELNGKLFDGIIFADVLEHLRNPEKVLELVKHFLKKSGSIYISIPNITHNSILINMINNKFNYTPTGILDETHLHFWGYDNLLELVYKLGMTPVMQKATYCGMENEVGVSYELISPILQQELLKRRYGHVYQFVLEIKDYDYVKNNNLPIIKDIRGEEQYKISVLLEGATKENSLGDFYLEQDVYNKQPVIFSLEDHDVGALSLSIKNGKGLLFKISVKGNHNENEENLQIDNSIQYIDSVYVINNQDKFNINLLNKYSSIQIIIENVDISIDLFFNIMTQAENDAAKNQALETEQYNYLEEKKCLTNDLRLLTNDKLALQNTLDVLTKDLEESTAEKDTLESKLNELELSKKELEASKIELENSKNELISLLQNASKEREIMLAECESYKHNNSLLQNELHELKSLKFYKLWRKINGERQ